VKRSAISGETAEHCQLNNKQVPFEIHRIQISVNRHDRVRLPTCCYRLYCKASFEEHPPPEDSPPPPRACVVLGRGGGQAYQLSRTESNLMQVGHLIRGPSPARPTAPKQFKGHLVGLCPKQSYVDGRPESELHGFLSVYWSTETGNRIAKPRAACF